jgi:hypothetical protein
MPSIARRACIAATAAAATSGGVVLAVPCGHARDGSAEAWPIAVHARYRLRFNGIDVGHIDFKSKTSAAAYSLAANGEVSLLFGAIKWTGATNVAGAIDAAAARPKTYAFDWKKQSKGGAIAMGYTGTTATSIKVEPPPNPGPDVVPLKDEHKIGPLDPLSAIMMLTRNDARAPCERREAVFDGKQRYDIVFTYKRQARIPAASAGGASTVGVVCRAMVEYIAGHKNDANHKAYAANHDAEVTLRPVPGTKLMIPYSVHVPTAWGTGSMVTERIDVTSATAGQVAFRE